MWGNEQRNIAYFSPIVYILWAKASARMLDENFILKKKKISSENMALARQTLKQKTIFFSFGFNLKFYVISLWIFLKNEMFFFSFSGGEAGGGGGQKGRVLPFFLSILFFFYSIYFSSHPH